MRPGWRGARSANLDLRGTKKALLGNDASHFPFPPPETANGRERVSGAEGAPGTFVDDGWQNAALLVAARAASAVDITVLLGMAVFRSLEKRDLIRRGCLVAAGSACEEAVMEPLQFVASQRGVEVSRSLQLCAATE